MRESPGTSLMQISAVLLSCGNPSSAVLALNWLHRQVEDGEPGRRARRVRPAQDRGGQSTLVALVSVSCSGRHSFRPLVLVCAASHSATPWAQPARLLCPPVSPGVCSDSLPLESVMPSNHLLCWSQHHPHPLPCRPPGQRSSR